MAQSDSAEANIMVFRRLIEDGFNRGSVGAVRELLTEDFVEHQDDGPGTPHGHEAVVAKIGGLHAAFPDLSLTIEDIVAEGDKVWARLRGHGTNAGPFMGAPTGGQINIDVIDICRFPDGRIAEHWGVADRLGTMRQVGRVPQPTGRS